MVIYPGILEQQFEFLMSQLRLNARQHHVSFSCGAVWKKECDSLDAILKEADEKMYEDKENFMRKQNTTGDGISAEVSMCEKGSRTSAALAANSRMPPAPVGNRLSAPPDAITVADAASSVFT